MEASLLFCLLLAAQVFLLFLFCLFILLVLLFLLLSTMATNGNCNEFLDTGYHLQCDRPGNTGHKLLIAWPPTCPPCHSPLPAASSSSISGAIRLAQWTLEIGGLRRTSHKWARASYAKMTNRKETFLSYSYH